MEAGATLVCPVWGFLRCDERGWRGAPEAEAGPFSFVSLSRVSRRTSPAHHGGTLAVRPEAALIVQCGRRTLDGAGAARVRALAARPVDWAGLLETARRHGALPLLGHHLEVLCSDFLPAAVLQTFRDHRRFDACRALRLAAELLRLLDALAVRGIPTVALKGPALGTALYGDLTLRPYGDLDLLVPETRLNDAEQVCRTLGYAGGPRGVWERVEWERMLSRERDVVDLHVRLSPPDFAFQLEADGLWGRRGRVQIGGRDVPTLGTEDLLLYLCAHGARHRWGRLKWIMDVAELIRRPPGVDWDMIFARAARLGGRRILQLGLTLAQEVLDAPVPHQVRREARSDRAVRRLTGSIQDRLFRQPAIQPADGWEWLSWYAGVRERASDKLRCAWRIVFVPGPVERQWLQLTRGAHALYYLARPVRLTWKYLLRRHARSA